MSLRDSQEWRLGQWGEREVRRKFEREGWFVVPVHLIEHEGAPGLTQALRKFVLPDLQVAGGAEMRWVEVKTKTRAAFYQKTGQWRHGIALRHWNDYLDVCAESGLPGYLAIVQLDPRMLLLGRFDWIGVDAQKNYLTSTSHGEEMIFFNVDRFDRLRLVDDEPWEPTGGVIGGSSSPTAPPVIEPKIVRPWEKDRKFPEAKQEMMPW